MACLLKTFLGIFVRQKKKWQIKSAFGRDNLGKANEKNANGNPRYQQCLQFSCFGHVNNLLYIMRCYVPGCFVNNIVYPTRALCKFKYIGGQNK